MACPFTLLLPGPPRMSRRRQHWAFYTAPAHTGSVAAQAASSSQRAETNHRRGSCAATGQTKPYNEWGRSGARTRLCATQRSRGPGVQILKQEGGAGPRGPSAPGRRRERGAAWRPGARAAALVAPRNAAEPPGRLLRRGETRRLTDLSGARRPTQVAERGTSRDPCPRAGRAASLFAAAGPKSLFRTLGPGIWVHWQCGVSCVGPEPPASGSCMTAGPCATICLSSLERRPGGASPQRRRAAHGRGRGAGCCCWLLLLAGGGRRGEAPRGERRARASLSRTPVGKAARSARHRP